MWWCPWLLMNTGHWWLLIWETMSCTSTIPLGLMKTWLVDILHSGSKWIQEYSHSNKNLSTMDKKWNYKIMSMRSIFGLGKYQIRYAPTMNHCQFEENNEQTHKVTCFVIVLVCYASFSFWPELEWPGNVGHLITFRWCSLKYEHSIVSFKLHTLARINALRN